MEKNMKKIPFTLLFCYLINGCAYAAVNPDDLIKVTNEANKQCVEYYNYKGEMYCSTKALSSQVVDPNIRNYETQSIVFDHRAWQPAWSQSDESGTTIEYVPIGDDINNWSELVTSQFFPGLQNNATPKEYADLAMQGIKDAGFDPIVTFIQTTPDQVILEFRILTPDNQIQDELQKITKGEKGIYILHYVIKKKDMGEVNRKLWLDNLTRSTIK